MGVGEKGSKGGSEGSGLGGVLGVGVRVGVGERAPFTTLFWGIYVIWAQSGDGKKMPC